MTVKIFLKQVRNAVVFRAVPRRDRVHFLGGGTMYVEPSDRRAQTLVRRSGLMEPIPACFWHDLCRSLRPDVVLDVGANYGEFILSTRFPTAKTVILIEANEQMLPYLRRSIASHPDRSKIVIENCAVWDQEGMVTFCRDRRWSGTSWATSQPEAPDADGMDAPDDTVEQISLRARTLDSVLAAHAVPQGARLAFKIDIEGAEERALKGLEATLRTSAAFAGVVEFDRDYLRRSGSDPGAVFDYLNTLGTTMAIDDQRKTAVVTSAEDLGRHANLILCSRDGPIAPWQAPALLRPIPYASRSRRS